MKVRTLDTSVRNASLLAGIPLLLSGLVPWSLDPPVFSWTIASQSGSIEPLLPAAAGFMILAVGLIPGLPRLLRGLLILAFAVTPIVLLADLVEDAGRSLPDPGGPLSAMGGDMMGIFLLAFLLAGITETVNQGLKASRLAAIVGFLGWTALTAMYVLPVWHGGSILLAELVESVGRVVDQGGLALAIGGTILLLLFAYFLLAVAGMVFAARRVIRSRDRRLAGAFKSGWAGVGASVGPAVLLGFTLVVVLVAREELAGLLAGIGILLAAWGFSVGATGGLAHTILGFVPSRPALAGAAEAGYAAQPGPGFQPASLPSAGGGPGENTLRAIEKAQAAIRQQMEYEEAQKRAAGAWQQPQFQTYEQQQAWGQPQEQPQQGHDQQQAWGQPQAQQDYGQQQAWGQPQAQPQGYDPAQDQVTLRQGPSAPPSGHNLQPYPGYPGYVVCPNCGGGIAINGAACTHCGQQVGW